MRTIDSLIAIVALQFAVASATNAAHKTPLTVRVKVRSGAPVIMVNDKPVRARMFFGGPGSAPIKLMPEGRRITFEFRAEADALGDGTMHFRFGQTPGDVYLDDIRVVDSATNREVLSSDFQNGEASFSNDWTTWPPAERNTVGKVAVESGCGANRSAGLHVTLKAPPNGNWPDFHMYHLPKLTFERNRAYRVTFWARAEPARDVTVALYRPGDTFTYLGGPPGAFDPQIKLAAQVGVNFVTFPIETPWPEPGKPVSWKSVDASCEQVLHANPKALLLPRLGADPPEWWRKANPDDVMTWEDGSQQYHAVVASPLYRKEASERVFELVKHLEAKFGDHMAGYHTCGQNTGEWFYQSTWESLLNGYAPADAEGFRVWLKERYNTDKALKAAWHDPDASLETASVPTAAARRASPNGILRDPQTEQSLVDFAEFQQSAMADLVCDLAHAVRTASQGRKLVVFFYGYVFEFGPIRLGPSTCGHYALRRVLESPDIDILCSPISYFDRGVGKSAPAMTAAESVALANKMWLFEDDTRTHLGTGSFPGEYEGALNPAETYTMLLRNLAEEATRNFGTWWMDLGMTGWFNDPGMWAVMRKMEPVDRYFLDHPTPFHPEVAAVIDEHSMMVVAANGWNVTDPGIYKARLPLARMGAPYGQYLFDDVTHGRVNAKLYVFLNAWRLTPQQRKEALKNTMGKVRIWCYAPGYVDGDHLSLNSMHELTGFTLKQVSPPKAVATPTVAGKKLGLTAPFGPDGPISPLFAATDATPAETLATYPDGSAAVAIRKTTDGWSIFVGAPGLTSELLRIAARKAGVHFFTETECNVYANGPYVALHASKEGVLTLNTGRRGAIRDAFTGKSIGNGPRVKLPMKFGETRVLRY